jgi:hypothetical protein
MKRFVAAIAIGALVLAGAGVAMAGTIGTPEIVAESATITVAPQAAFVPTSCTGVGGVPYVSYVGASWVGTETAAAPVLPPFNLTGTFSVTGIVWTINLSTGRGLLRGTAVFASPASAKGSYKGTITLVTQGVPGSDQIQARGWISATTSAPGGGLFSNVEFEIGPGFTAAGEFGSSMGFSDLSAWTDGHYC